MNKRPSASCHGNVSRIAFPLAALLTALFAGCTPAYVVPPEENSAKLRFKVDVASRTTLSHVLVSPCPDLPAKEVIAVTADDMFSQGETSPIRMIGGSEAAETRIRERLITAGRPFLYEIRTPAVMVDGRYVYECRLSAFFTPEVGAEYEMDYSIGIGSKRCSVQLFRLSRGSAGEVLRARERSHRQVIVANDAEYCSWQPRQTAADLFESLLEDSRSADATTPLPPPAASQETVAGETSSAAEQPRAGDRWIYSLSSANRSQGTVQIEILDSTSRRVTERVSRAGYPDFAKERSIDWVFNPRQFQEIVTLPGGYLLAEIAPYFPSGTPLAVGDTWKNIPGRFVLPHAGTKNFVLNARVAAQETVRLPAGDFDTWRIEVLSEPEVGQHPSRVRCTFWYSPQYRRTVKINLKVESPFIGAQADDTYTLVAYERAQ
jgi:hypothetical protein